MTNYEFGQLIQYRTKHFALQVIQLFNSLNADASAKIIGKQLLRSATSVAANYRAALRARSKREFYSKLCIVVEETDESLFWLEILEESKIAQKDSLDHLKLEITELLKILSKARKNAKP